MHLSRKKGEKLGFFSDEKQRKIFLEIFQCLYFFFQYFYFFFNDIRGKSVLELWDTIFLPN